MFNELLQQLAQAAPEHSRTAIGPVHGSAAARLIVERAESGPLQLVITSDGQGGSQLLRELDFYGRGRDLSILRFPDWETLPYDNFSPHQDIVSERLHALYHLPNLQGGIVVVPISTLMHRLPPTEYVTGYSLVLELGQKLDLEEFRRRLERNGYRSVDTVFEHGEYAMRGSLFDIYPMGSRLPFRIDMLDDEIETLRTFDPETQRTIEQVDAIDLLPAREFALDRRSIMRFQDNWLAAFDVDHDACPMYSEVGAGRIPGGCEYYLPLFFEHCATLFDYLPDDCQVSAIGSHHSAAEHFWSEITHRFEEYGVDPRRPLLPPTRGFLTVAELYSELGQHHLLELRTEPDAPTHMSPGLLPPPDLSLDQSARSPALRIAHFVEEHHGPVLLCAESAGRREILLESLAELKLHPTEYAGWDEFISAGADFGISTAPIDRGVYFGDDAPTLICEAQLFGNRIAQRRRRETSAAQTANAFRDINELRPGVPVVHFDHGVGRYLGLESLDVDEQLTEFIALAYAEGAKLYVPVASLHLISRYAGADPEIAPLHRLGSDSWQKARRKAAEKVNDVAAELLEIYARREAKEGYQFKLEPGPYEQFSDAFPFEETPDQVDSIKAVVDDMTSARVMDRLVCGDVGFGKTEVAMRAAFIAVQNARQVAILVPTTLLAQQHHSSFSDRFADWPVQVEVLSRFRSAAEQSAILERVKNGKVDILIGTHKLLNSSVTYQDLGLLIIDEEHRFGVKQKDSIKALRAEVDILTLTATPIPRTLNMALGGMRDLSIIATPPARRLSIKTFVREHNIGLIKEAVLRETLRGGQVYYLHNEVKTIEERARKLRELVPELRVAVAHGQMREQQLEQVMSDFYHQKFHVLLCTTIIETGIDVPSANTIIIERADRFGLAQLHQLRGRVGRSHHQAYAYLLCPPRSAITTDAEKRLDAIEAAGDLGAGYLLATHDLEIRGAGELLGEDQSGQIHSVGYSLYMDMLERAVTSLRNGEIPDIDDDGRRDTEVNLRIPALIPDDYLPDINTRLVLYKRIAGARDDSDLREIQVEMIDRFGLLPEATRNLFTITQTKLLASALGITKIEAGDRGGSLDFADNTQVDPLALVKLVQKEPHIYRLVGGTRLRFDSELPEFEERYQFVQQLIEKISPDSSEAAA
ncbi:transcription-repair coupling factor [Halieaceae bacterium IMCC14734]|uniref:Transcription-repair-coupling factor n=1 Tax=Candidatus Litorirhabdus singularis TaxID=2518993 RepID=A0ABT3TGI5_9GAMM|nr:transcription-repair coupling factor [Candidatus Litorirhabdus singularis]MCX2981428.1 transcription-repair coupling factor [Candidatus Litorirhabdus singularis]